MKRYLMYATLGLTLSSVHSQDLNDALRYSQTNIQGTARYRAMGGAFTALGGELSAISLNPASSSVFYNSQVGMSVGSKITNSKANYFGTNNSSNESAFYVNQVGGVWVFNSNSEETSGKVTRFAVGLNYENENKFNQSYAIKGMNNNASVADYFLAQANGVSLNLLQTQANETPNALYEYLGENYANGFQYQNAFLGYETYVVNAHDNNAPNNIAYYSNVPTGTYNQWNFVDQSGRNGKLSFNISAEFNRRFHIGVNLNSHMVNYTKTTIFTETNSNPENVNGETVRSITHSTDMITSGSGFSVQLGAIARVTDGLRLGVSYQSPTWYYRLNDEFIQGISTSRENNLNTQGGLLNATFNPSKAQLFPEYSITTPAKYNFGGAYVFGDRGLISVDYTLTDYAAAKLRPTNNTYFALQNQVIKNTLNWAYELRVGGEMIFNQWSVRAGYNMQQSPYKDKSIMGDLKQYNLGLGYNFGATKLDLSYSLYTRDFTYNNYNVGLVDKAQINQKNHAIFLTALFEL